MTANSLRTAAPATRDAPAEPEGQSPFASIPPLLRLLTFGFFWAYLIVVASLALISNTPGAYLVVPALVLFLAVKVAPLAFYRSDHGWFYPPIFLLLLFVIRLLRSAPMYIWGMPYHIALPDFDQYELARVITLELLVETAGWLAYFVGFAAGPRPPIPPLTFGTPARLGLKVSIIVLLTTVVAIIFLQRQGGVIEHILSWGQTRHVAVGGEYYWIATVQIGLYATLLWLILDQQAWRNPIFWLAMGVSLISTFLMTGSRSSVIVPAILGLLGWMLRRRQIMFGRLVYAGMIALVLLNILGNFRRSTWSGEIDWGALTSFSSGSSISVNELVERTTSRNGTTPILARVPNEVELLYGSSYLAVLVLPIPRGLWEDKPGGIDGRVGNTFFNNVGGVPPGPVGEAYWNFALPGVIVVFLIFGIFHRWLAEAYRRYAAQPAMALPYIAALYIIEPSSSKVVDALLLLVPVSVMLVAFGAVRLPWRRNTSWSPRAEV